MDLSKSYEFFQPEKDQARIHIVGCGSVGSTVAENLARCGVTKMTLWDFDKVEPHNIVNQMFDQNDVGKLKVEALKDILTDINPEISDQIEIKPEGWQGKLMSGYIFLCVDSIELRREIVEKHFDSPYVKADSMQFSHDEAKDETPVSACGVTLGVATTVRLISALGVNNYINFVKGNGIKKLILMDGFQFDLMAF